MTPFDLALNSFRVNLDYFNDYSDKSQKCFEQKMTFLLEIFSRLVSMIIEPFNIDPKDLGLGSKWVNISVSPKTSPTYT